MPRRRRAVSPLALQAEYEREEIDWSYIEFVDNQVGTSSRVCACGLWLLRVWFSACGCSCGSIFSACGVDVPGFCCRCGPVRTGCSLWFIMASWVTQHLTAATCSTPPLCRASSGQHGTGILDYRDHLPPSHAAPGTHGVTHGHSLWTSPFLFLASFELVMLGKHNRVCFSSLPR